MDNVGVLLFLVGAVGTWYFIKKKPDKNNRNISIGLLAVGIALIVIFTEDTEEVATESSEAKVEQAESSSSEVENQASSEVVEESSEELSEVVEETTDWVETNELIAEHIELNKGWALGTIDENGNPIENGEPNPDYRNWLYVNNLTVDNSGAILNVTADFQDLSEMEKNALASAAQGIVMSYGGEPRRTFLEVRNGDTLYGSSKILDTTEFKWQ